MLYTESPSNYSIPMGLVDFIPVVCFIVGGYFLIRALYKNIKLLPFVGISGGIVCMSLAGTFKAIWKILLATNFGDFERLNSSFLPMQSVGYVLIGIGLITILIDDYRKKNNTRLKSLALPALLITSLSTIQVIDGTMIFISFMITGALLMSISLSYVSVKNKCWIALALTIVMFISNMMMGCMAPISKKIGDVALSNWIEEIINIFGQAAYLALVLLLNNKGFFKYRKSFTNKTKK